MDGSSKTTSSLFEEMFQKGPPTPLGMMAAALEWYGSEANWRLEPNRFGENTAADLDKGLKARQALTAARDFAVRERMNDLGKTQEAMAKMQCPRCLVDFLEHTPHGFVERFGGKLHDSERCAENLRIQIKHFELLHKKFLKEAGELLGTHNAQPWTYMDILHSIKAFKERVDHLHQSQPREKEFNAGVEAACLSIENHCCVSSCCDAQPGASTAKALANCVRKNHRVST